jgi:glyoxylase-like metal-dependent hydrolase (beta-lactamase superfamily II)
MTAEVSAAIDSRTRPEEFIRISDRLSLWQGDLDRHEQTNVGIVRGDDSIVVIDANFASAAYRILATIEGEGPLRVSHVVNTHYHVDHSLGNSVYVDAGAIVVGARGQRRELLEKGSDDAVIQVGAPPERFYPATLEFSGTITFCDSSLELIAVGPAHTIGDVIAWLPEEKTLFVGDLAVAWAHGNNFSDVDADLEGWIRALSQCIALRPTIVVPAHGAISGIEVLIEQRNFTEELWAWALDAVAEGTNTVPESTVSAFVERFPAFAVNPKRFTEMARSMLAAAVRKGGFDTGPRKRSGPTQPAVESAG